MVSEVVRLRVSWRRDASSDEALQAVVKAAHTGFGTRLATDGEAATQMALRYEDDDGEMCSLTALTLEDCLDISSNMVKLLVERLPLEARADRSVSLEVQDSAEVQADETSLSTVMTVDSGHRGITAEAAADVCKGRLCCGGGREAHLQSVLQSISVRCLCLFFSFVLFFFFDGVSFHFIFSCFFFLAGTKKTKKIKKYEKMKNQEKQNPIKFKKKIKTFSKKRFL